jgi:hypothetical protein
MANFTDMDDLRNVALWRAGEPQDSTSDFWAQSLTYLNKVQQILLLGGGAAVGRDLATSAGIYNMTVQIPMVDWWWARKRGVLTTTEAVDDDGGGTATTVTATKDSATLTFSNSITPDVAGYRIIINNQETLPIILTHGGSTATATMDAVWPQATETAVTYKMWPEEVSLATDFLRFAGEPWLHSDFGPGIPGMSKEQMLSLSPMQTVSTGAIRSFAIVGDQTIVFDRFDTERRYRFEYDYVAQPSDLGAGDTPLLPRHHRQVLSTGAAMLMLQDKNDARAENLASEFRELVMRMGQEHRKILGNSSSMMAQFAVRGRNYRGRRRGAQTKGEQFLV